MSYANDIVRWTNEGNRLGATHLIVMCDEFDFTYYPKYVMNGENLQDIIKTSCTSMQQMNQVILLNELK